jgi:hypothetical protein
MIIARVISSIALLTSSIALAQPTCPEKLPHSERARRQLASEWFERGERSVAEERFEDAVRAYACSMKIVEHAFTAYNLALAAEKAHDPSTAIDGYRRYLALSPHAKDRASVEEKIGAIEASLAKPAETRPPPAVTNPAPPPPPPQIAPAEPPPLQIAPPSVAPERELTPAGLITLGAGAAVGVAGIVLNVLARSRAGASRDAYADEEFDRSDDLHGQARAMAYSSYAGIGVGIAAAFAGGLLLLLD